MSLKQVRKLNFKQIDKITIFASLHRQSCRSISFEFSYFFGLATEPRSFSTGLFLCLKSYKNGYSRQSHAYSCSKQRLKYGSICDRRRNIFLRTWSFGGLVISDYQRGLGGVKEICRRSKVILLNYCKSLVPTSVENRKKDVGPGISIRPKSLLNSLSGRQHYPGGA